MLSLLLLTAVHAADTDTASTWLPLAEGNEWIFVEGGAVTRIGVDGVYGDHYYWLTGLLGVDAWVWHDATDADEQADIWHYNSATDTWATLMEAASAGTWSFSTTGSYCSTYAGSNAADGVSVSGAGTSFSGARTVAYSLVPEPNVRCMAKEMEDITFAPGVGPVAFESARGETWSLQGARVDGEWIAAAVDADTDGSLEVTLLTDAADYTHEDTGVRCVTTPCPATAPAKATVTIMLANTGSSALTLDFSSGLQVDVDVYSVDGYWLWSWSDDKVFTQATTQVTLEAGERRLFSRTVSLVDEDGEPLSGDLALAAWVPAADVYPAVWLTASH